MGSVRTHISLAIFILSIVLGLLTDNALGDYCASINTGADFKSTSYMYQSHGACQQTCGDKYAFAILQGKSCWCSNVAPGVTTSNNDCNQGCPGFPQEKCGNEASGLYGYVALGPAPTSTQGGSSSTTSQATRVTITLTNDQRITVVQTILQSPSPTSATPSVSTSVVTSVQSVTSALTSTWIPTPVTTVRTVTGAIQTVTLIPTEPPATTLTKPTAALSTAIPSKSGSSISGGAIAGIVIGIICVVGIVIAALVFCYLRRRRNNEVASEGGSTGSRTPPRSRGSLSGLINSVTGDSNRPMAEANNPAIQVWPSKPTKPPNDRQPSHDYIRFDKYHQPRLVDQRLDPKALWGRNDAGSSRTSVRSFRDDQDYSRRVLHLTNPDH